VSYVKSSLCASIVLACFSTVSHSHGYIDISRGKLCAQGQNSGCGSVIYEPQSLEGDDRFPAGGPPDGQIPSAGLSRFSQLNEQTPTRWHKTDINSGANTFNWHFTAPHSTLDWRYFITKTGWNPYLPLDRAAFETAPFCTYQGNYQRPPTNLSHQCIVPDRSGYHVILAVWDVGDTSKSFYNVLDVNIAGTPPAGNWIDIGDINPTEDLAVGDSVLVRFFDADGELFARQLEMQIETAEDGAANTWPKLLAEFIIAETSDIRAGIIDDAGEIVPAFGRNDIYADNNSGIVRAEIDIVPDGQELPPDIQVRLGQTEFPAQVPLDLGFTVTTNQLLNVTADLYFQSVSIGHAEADIQGTQSLTIAVDNPEAGDYQLVVTGSPENGSGLDQETFDITVSEAGESQYVYPQGRGSYQQGDLVTGQDGNIYECLIAPWCNHSPTYYAPGLGLAWSSAWQQVGAGTPPPIAVQYVYPEGRGQYQQGTIVQGQDGNPYRCNISGWCNSTSSFYYAPGTGLAWQSAWSAL